MRESNLCPRPASALGDGEPVDWIWEGYLAVGSVTLLVGIWKGGKTTLLAHLLRATGGGGEVGQPVGKAGVLVVTEEGDGLWASRRDSVGIDDNVHFITRPFKGRATRREWERFVGHLAEEVREGSYALVVFDTWQSVSPSEDENDAAKMMAALMPLHRITEAGAAVLLIHHPRKGDGQEGTASRGSGALTGFVDIIIELRRFDRERADDRRRVLRGISRFDETPQEVVIELRDDGYHVVGSKADAKRDDRMDVIREILADASEPLIPEEIREKWPDDGVPKPGRRTVEADLKAGHVAGDWTRDGKGVKNNPYTFASRKLPPLSARDESNAQLKAARDEAAGLIREARRGGDNGRAVALRDARRERLAIATMDGDLSVREAETVARDELRRMSQNMQMRTGAIGRDAIRSSATQGR